jgi:hypothetical protein
VVRVRLLALFLAVAAPAAAENLIQNGGFEQIAGGAAVGWPGLGMANLSTSIVRSGQRAAAIERDGPGAGPTWQQGWLPTESGRAYKLVGYLRCDRFEGDGWGFPELAVIHADWSDTRISPERILARCGDGAWHGFALRFTARPGGTLVRFGVYGPKAAVRLYFDDLALFEAPASNQPPSLSAELSPLTGTVPFAVSFAAQAEDPDGVVEELYWDMGDGRLYDTASGSHLYRSRGPHPVRLVVVDDDGARVERSYTVLAEDPSAPTLIIVSPAPGATTAAESIAISGSASPALASPAPLQEIVWDALDLEPATAGRIPAAASFTIPAVPLKPGRNRILLTLRDQAGRIATQRIEVIRTLSAPLLRELWTAPRELSRFQTWRATFRIDTVARFPFYDHDPAAPPGSGGEEGVRVEAEITLPDGRLLIQPAYARADLIEREGLWHDTGTRRFELRYTPQTTGIHALRLRLRDASGESLLDLGTLQVNEGSRLGFIRRAADPRYFERDSGHPYVPIGPALDPRFHDNQGALTWRRPWLGGFGAFSTNWSRWISSAGRHGNEGFMAALEFRERLSGSELSFPLFCSGSCGASAEDGEGWRLWQGFLLEGQTGFRVVAGRRYRLLLRLKLEPMTPRAGGVHGLAVRLHGWPPPGQGWREYLEGLGGPHVILPPLPGPQPWHTRIVDFTAGLTAENLSLHLHNVAAGLAWLDTISLRELDAGGAYASGELLRNPRADHHRYVDEKGAREIEHLLAQAEAQGLALQMVVQDKNDWLPNHLSRHGLFTRRGDGYYQGEGTRWRWLARQWWRYLAARYGPSTAVFAFELNNEGSPDDRTHWQAAEDFARFFAHQAHPHLASTSFWCCWRPAFWGDHQNYPHLGYADLHEYTSDGELGSQREALEADFAALHLFRVEKVRQSPVGRPVIRAESGLEPGTANFALLAEQPNPGYWFHNLLWAQLDGSGVFDPGYWWQEHFEAIDRELYGSAQGGRSRIALARPYALFVAGLNRENGGFVDLAAEVQGELRVVGQRHPGRGEAHLWVQNPRSTWKRWLLEPGSVIPASGSIRIPMGQAGLYRIERFDTWQGGILAVEHRQSDAAGWVDVTIAGLERDVAFRLRRIGTAGAIFADGFEGR